MHITYWIEMTYKIKISMYIVILWIYVGVIGKKYFIVFELGSLSDRAIWSAPAQFECLGPPYSQLLYIIKYDCNILSKMCFLEVPNACA